MTYSIKEQQTFSLVQRKIEQLQKEIDNLQLKYAFETTLPNKGTADVLESGALIISKGLKFTYCGYFTERYDLGSNFCYRFIVDDRLTESILLNHEQAKNLKAFTTKLGDFFATYKGYNTTYTSYEDLLRQLNLSRLNKDMNFKELDDSLKIYKALKAAGFKVINF